MSITLTVPEKTNLHLTPRISIIELGAVGDYAVNTILAQDVEGVDFVVLHLNALSFD